MLFHAVPRVQGLKIPIELTLKQKLSLTLIFSVHVTLLCPLTFWLEEHLTYYLWQFFRIHKQSIYSSPLPWYFKFTCNFQPFHCSKRTLAKIKVMCKSSKSKLGQKGHQTIFFYPKFKG